MEAFRAALTERGFKPEDITVQPVNSMPKYSNGMQVGYTLVQSIFLISKDIDAIEELALNPGKITERDIVFQYSNLEYYYSELSEMKLSLLSAATKDARRRADEIASGTGDEIGAIQSARTGVFQITEPYSTEVSDYGIYNVGSRTKDITVTVTVVYTIK
ncbi:MAG TPA: SIMPL domain-containing protein, partial [Firmicutes bacterium]|nr:SIMPL domain-containing protein [Bacillota bacterium]